MAQTLKRNQFEFVDEQPAQNANVQNTSVPKTLKRDQFVFADEPQEEQEPGILKKIGQAGLGLANQAVQAPFKLAELPVNAINYLTGAEPRIKHPISKQIQEGAESLFGKKALEAENPITKTLQYTAGNWPALFLGGAPTAATLGADLAGSAGIVGAEAAGLGPIGAILGGMAGSKAFNKSFGVANKINKTAPEKRAEFISDLYKKEKDLGSKIKIHNVSNVRDKLNDIYADVKKEYVNPGKFDEAARSRVVHNIENAEKSIYKKDLTASDLFKEKQNLNNAYSFKNSTENKYYNRIRNVFKNELSDVSEKHPEWGKTYTNADELYAISKWQTGLTRNLDELKNSGILGRLVTNDLTYGALSLISGLARGKTAGLLPVAGKFAIKYGAKGADVAGRESQFIYKLWNMPEGKKLLQDIVADSAKGSAKSLAQHINKLNKYADEYQEE